MTEPEHDPRVPPVGEEVHLPGPTILPLITALGVTVTLVGITLSVVIVIAGGALTLACVWRWIGETRRDVAELPLERR